VLPRLFRIWRLRLRSLARKDAVDAELHRELVFHFDELVAEKIDEGLSPAEARRAAHRDLGNLAALEEYCRDERRATWLHDIRQDVVYGMRMLRKHPGLTAIAIASLALGIGANAAVLGAFDALLFRGLPVPGRDRLVAIQSAPLDNPSQLGGLSLVEYAALRDNTQVFDTIDASIRWMGDVAADAPGDAPERIVGQLVTPGWLSMLGIQPLRGRAFTAEEGQPGRPHPIVISHAFWQRRFGGDPDITTRQVRIRIQGGSRTIVGVMPPELRYQHSDIDYWAPLHVGAQPDAGARLFAVRARLKPGVTLAHAQGAIDAVAAQLASERSQSKGWGLSTRPLNEYLFGWTRQPLLTFQAAVALVLLIACVNVAALLLSRAAFRQREVALRVALGAGRGRIFRQLLTESMLLATAGGALGLVVAVLGQGALTGMTAPPASPPLSAIGLNGRVFALLALLTIVTGIACGLVPALRGSKLNPMGSLKDAHPSEPAARRRRFPRGALVSLQLGLALVLLVGSGLLLNSLVRLLWRDLNFDPAGLVRIDYGVPSTQYAQRIGTHEGFPYFAISPPPSQKLQQVLERLRAVPGARSVAGISSPPVDSFVPATMEVALESGERQPSVYFVVTPNLFETLRTPIVHGRDFTDRDSVSAPWVAIVNETCARRLWPGEDAIGKRLTLDTVPEEQTRLVIGVVRDIPTRHARPAEPVIYASYLQQPPRYRAPWVNLFGQMTFIMRAAGDPDGLIPLARQALAGIDPDRPVARPATVESHMRNATGQFRYFVLLISVFAGVATLLAAIGTYGVMAYSVNLRTREIGIRRALGAGRVEVIMMIGRRALALVGSGLVCGVAGALLFTRLIASRLWGVSPTDPATFVGVSLLLVAVAIVACIAPARRALAVDPTTALRTE
jgi:predicted permease